MFFYVSTNIIESFCTFVPQNNTNMAVKVGNKAPNTLGKDENGNLIQLSDYQGKKVILYFFVSRYATIVVYLYQTVVQQGNFLSRRDQR